MGIACDEWEPTAAVAIPYPTTTNQCVGVSCVTMYNYCKFNIQLLTAGTPQSIADADGRRKSLQWLRAILPRDHAERRVLGTVGVVRLILMPMASMAIVGGLAALGLLPDDPICRLVLLVEGSMPTAQNLVLLMNLNTNTQPLASRTGKLLLRLYPIAILPVTVWMTLFVQWMPVPLAAL